MGGAGAGFAREELTGYGAAWNLKQIESQGSPIEIVTLRITGFLSFKNKI